MTLTKGPGDVSARPGRGSAYSVQEDAILLQTRGASPEETNARLVEAGFQERSPTSIKQRRYYLSRRREVVTKQPDGTDERLSAALRRRAVLRNRLVQMETEIVEVRRELDHLNEEIAVLLDVIRQEVEGDASGNGPHL